ncbi:transcription factor HES-7.1-like [Myxocyprinus asiaticus]|uniref:transcription factor HES-7.1-like n=1 Tax=Myxocyprinus asiaticus TaxID=70543 RepID=UPI0022216933|nr:transcription factor HES-7.1-like [Myxocyprinus asiaticus]
MKMLGETENIKMDRKLLKPQVERRRRERMNRSLENLRTLLLQGPEHNSSTQRRMEKAEILEYTVLFLQNSVAQAKKAKDEEGREKHQFIDGFSTCLQKAARFMIDEGEARGLEGSVSATLCQRLSQPSVPANIRLPVRIQNSSRIQVPGSTVQHHLHLEKQQQNLVCRQGLSSAGRNIVVHLNRSPFRSTEPSTMQSHGKTHTVAQPTSQHQAPVSETVWRPWP